MVPHGRARQPPRRDVVPDRPAGYDEKHPEQVRQARALLSAAAWKQDDPLPVYPGSYDEIFENLPGNFDDDLHNKPEAHRQWRHDQQHGIWGYIDPEDKRSWLRHLDYYVELHRLADRSLGVVLDALEQSGAWDETIVIFTSDHGDMCGSHGLRSKGPVRLRRDHACSPVRAGSPGSRNRGPTEALATHVDLARTICGSRVPVKDNGGLRAPGRRISDRCSRIRLRLREITCCSRRTRRRPRT
jgi:arylsulfatase A-like enzyme